jgi:putative ABC transport system permease protein
VIIECEASPHSIELIRPGNVDFPGIATTMIHEDLLAYLRFGWAAESRSVFGLATRQALVVAAIGIGIGLGGALLLGRTLADLLYGVGPGDASTLAAAAAVVLIVALLACWRPAWRATRVDPSTALRAG